MESLNGKLPDDPLTGGVSHSLTGTGVPFDPGRREYDRVRPRRALGYSPPAPEFLVLRGQDAAQPHAWS